MHEISEKIKQAWHIAILPHIDADADALGSSYAMDRVLRSFEKNSTVILEDPPKKNLAFIEGNYEVFAGNESESEDYDLCIALDCADVQRLGRRAEILKKSKFTINIDHHYSNTKYGDINLIDAEAAATGEILSAFFKETGVKFDRELASLLYTAISADTGSFKYSNTTPVTMRIVSELMEYKFDHAEIARLLFDSETYESALFSAEVTAGIKSFADGKIRVVKITKELCEKYGFNEEDIPDAVNIPRRIEGTEIAVCIKEHKGSIRVNLRSNGYADVSKVAASLGGGGHVRAAGCTIKSDDIDLAEQLVIEECQKVL